MAGRMLAAGFPLTVWARRTVALEPLVAAGAKAVNTVADLARAADHVGICVVNDAGVTELCDVLIPEMKPGSLLAIHSTILPETCETLEVRCAARGIRFVDAPVSGGGGAAAAGKLTVMCGGVPEAFDRARPVFESFAGTIVHLGPAGAGQRAKIVNNALMAAHMGLAHAALATGDALGIEKSALAALIGQSSGRSFGFEVYARLPDPSAFEHGARLLQKDVDLLEAISDGRQEAAAISECASLFLRPAPALRAADND